MASSPGVSYHKVKTKNKQTSRNIRTSEANNCEEFSYRGQYSLNSLWSIWYGTMAVAFQIYIIAKSVKRFTGYISLPWPHDQPPYKELNAYVILTGLGVVILPFFVVASMMKIGNYSNDGRKLGAEKKSDDHEAVYENIKSTSYCVQKKKRFRALKQIWKHSLPTVALLHTLAAICFLVSRLLMESQIIKYGFLAKGDIWRTEMDFLLKHLEDGKVPLLGFLKPINETDKRWLGKSKDQDLFADAMVTRREEMKAKLDLESGRFSSEFINFAIALSVNAVRYPSVFWKVSKSFGLVFSVILVVNTIQSLISFSAFTVLYKIQVFNPEKLILHYPSKLSLDAFQTLILFLAYLTLVMMTSCVFYLYGLNKFEECRNRSYIKFHVTSPRRSALLWGYCPHFFAFISLMLLAFCGIPLVYDFVVVYCGTLDATSLVGAAAVAFQLIFWILMWLLLTIKSDWKFVAFTEEDESKIYSNQQTKPLMKGEPPLLVIQNGQTFQIRENSSKKAIIHLVHNLLPSQKSSQSPVGNEDIYWLKPSHPSPKDETKNNDSTMSWLRNKTSKKGNQTLEKTACNKSKKKSNKSKKSTGIEVDDGNSDDGDYATLRQIVHRDETDENLANSTHLSLCPLKGEQFNAGQPLMSSTINGDYELLVETNSVPNDSVINSYSNDKRPHFSSTRNTQLHNQSENLTPCSASLSESSNSPEKSSETSSGVHSNSSSGQMEKRSNSVENLLQYMNTKQAWKSLSLQRYIGSVPYERPQRVTCIMNGSETLSRSNTMAIRRMRPHTEVEGSKDKCDLFGRTCALKMTSFTETPDCYTNSQETTIANSSDQQMSKTLNSTISNDDHILHLRDLEPTIPNTSAIAMMYSHQRRDSANFSLTSSAEDSDVQKI